MSDRGYKRPRPTDSSAPPARPRSPERVPVYKKARREDDDHPANKLPPALRGRVTLPGEHRNRADDPRAAVAAPGGAGHADREHDHTPKQHSSKRRGAQREVQQNSREAQSGAPADGGASNIGQRPPSAERGGRSQASRYDMSSSDHRSSRGPGSSSSRRPTLSDRLQASTGPGTDAGSLGLVRPLRLGDGRSSSSRRRTREPDGGRADRRAPAGGGEGATRREEGSHHERGRRGDRSSGRACKEQRSRPHSHHDQVRGSDRSRHASAPGQKLGGQGRQSSNPGPAAEDPAVGQQPPLLSVSSPLQEEGEALPTPTAPAAAPVECKSHHEKLQQPQGVIDVSPGDGGAEAGGSGRNSHQPIKFTLQKLPSVTAEELKPKHSSKYSLPPEAHVDASPREQLHSKRNNKDHQHAQQQQRQQQQHEQPPRQQEEQQQQQSSRPLSADRDRREVFTANGNSRHTVIGKPDHSSHWRDTHQQHLTQPTEATQQQEAAGIRRREPSRELSQDVSRDHNGRGHSSRLQRVRDSSRPATTSSQSGHQATSSLSEQVATAVEVRSNQVVATAPAKTADDERQAQQQHSSIPVTLGSRMSCAALGSVAPGVLSGQPALCAEGQARTAAVRGRQEGLVVLQLQGLPISKQLCFTETWEKLVEVTRTHPDAIDSDHVALQRRCAAAKAVTGRACCTLLPPLPAPRHLTASTSDEQHLRHLQGVIDSYVEDKAAASCVHLIDGGSMWLQ